MVGHANGWFWIPDGPDINGAAESFSVTGRAVSIIVADRLGGGDPRARAVVFLHGGGRSATLMGSGRSRLSPNVAGKRSRDRRSAQGAAGPTGVEARGDYRLRVASPAISRRCCATCLEQPALVDLQRIGLPRCCWRGSSRRALPAQCGGTVRHRAGNWTCGPGRESTRSWPGWAESGFGSLDEVADVIANYNPHPAAAFGSGWLGGQPARAVIAGIGTGITFIGGMRRFPP